MLSYYLISQATNDGYDTYDSAVVVAFSGEQATHIHPSGRYPHWQHLPPDDGLDLAAAALRADWTDCWANPSQVSATFLAEVPEGLRSTRQAGDVICASFHAG